MAREDFSERGLPSLEVRRQILRRAGVVLNEARDLLAQLDRDELMFPRSVQEHEVVLDRMTERCSQLRLGPVPQAPGISNSQSADCALAA